MEISPPVDAIVMYRRGRIHPESDFPNAYLLNPLPNRNAGNELRHIPPEPPSDNPWAKPAFIAFGFPTRGYENTVFPSKTQRLETGEIDYSRTNSISRQNLPPMTLVEFGELYQVDDVFCRRWPLWVREIRKCGLPNAPICIFGARPNTRCPGVIQSNCCTWEFKCNILIAV